MEAQGLSTKEQPRGCRDLFMLFVQKLFGRRAAEQAPPSSADRELPPQAIRISDAPPFELAPCLHWHESFPVPDWDAVIAWTNALQPTELQGEAWARVERGWLLHLRDALGGDFRVDESGEALLVSSLEPRVARATLDYMTRTLARVGKLLDGIAQVPPWGKDILVVFDDDESYYRYVSYYYPEAGEFAFSGGMHIDAGSSHYVTVKGNLSAMEPVIAHEMTHGCLGHLPLPLWLNEGLAVNVEHQLAGARPTHTPQQLRAKHLGFWGPAQIQGFWSGASFQRTDDGNLLSYDLARLMVEQMSGDWERFRPFVLAAHRSDAGQAAAQEHLELDLGDFASALLASDSPKGWAPDPSCWLPLGSAA